MSVASENPYLLTLPDLLSAKKKLAVVAASYDPAKTSMKGFEGLSLDPTEFREQLRRNFLVSLTNAELGALVMYFDRDDDKMVNSAAFIGEFLRLGDIERKRIADRARENGRKAEALKKRIKKEQEEKLAKLNKYHIPETFTPEDEKSAVKKFSMLALSHSSYNKIAFQGFVYGGSLSAVQFKEQLKRNFCLYLSPGEVAALMHLFDTNGDGSVDCHEFLQHFFKIGYIEREKFHKKHIAKCQRYQEKEAQRQQERAEEFFSKSRVQLAPATDDDRESLSKKIETIAADYERREQWGNAFSAFEYASLDPTAFREVLRNSFGLHVTSGELSVLLELYGTSHGEIDCGQFLSAFFLAGKDEKERRMMKRMQVHDRLMRIRKKYEEDMERELLGRKKTAVEYPVLPQLSAPVSSSTHHNSSTFQSIGEEDETAMVGELGMSSSMVSGHSQRSGKTRRRTRKPSVLDAMNPNRAALQMYKSEGSIVNVYPAASTDTKNFLLQLEKEEEEVKKMKKRRKKKKPVSNQRRKSAQPATASAEDDIHNMSPGAEESEQQRRRSMSSEGERENSATDAALDL